MGWRCGARLSYRRSRPSSSAAGILRRDASSPRTVLCLRGIVRTGGVDGSPLVLEGARAQLHLAHTSATGSGPTGPSVTLELGVVFTDKAEGHTWNGELGAATTSVSRIGSAAPARYASSASAMTAQAPPRLLGGRRAM
jgi:hypothetical protein